MRVLLQLLMLSLCSLFAIADDQIDEDRLKVAYIYNFLKFTTWPDKAFEDATSSIKICSLGRNPLSGKLVALSSKRVRGREVKIEQLAEITSGIVKDSSCHLLFVDESHSISSDFHNQLHGVPLLVVGDVKDFAAKGGAIGLKIIDNKVRFEINIRAAKDHDLVFSSLLLTLANKIHGS